MGRVDFSSPYLSRGLIAYIGNKRSLLPFLASAFERCAAELDGGGLIRFLDPFAGSGGVSRLARAMGCAVFSNDREYYAAVIARCRAAMDLSRLEAAFAAEGGSARAFAELDALARGGGGFEAEPYIARHYAPRDTVQADWRSERLFYTTENARYIDRLRSIIEERYPFDVLDPAADPLRADAKAALLDSLIYEAATRVNTSGVFKACHRGFGGHGGDALTRILAPMRIRPPDLVAGPDARIGAADAAAFSSAVGSVDIAYLDPPYNQHQYGSNYHLLTTIARWDRPPVPENRDGTGFLTDRSGIRPDWVSTRSDFCRKGKASPAFASLLDSIDARFVLVSYNDGGIIPLEELREMLSARGELRIEAVPYVAYRGGKQSATRTERTSELLFVLDTAGRELARSSASKPASERADPADALSGGAADELRRIRLLGKLDALRKERFDPRRFPRRFAVRAGIAVGPSGRLSLNLGPLSSAPLPTLAELADSLSARACGSNVEAFDLVFRLYRGALADQAKKKREAAAVGRDALSLLRKIAFRKYSAEYKDRSAALRAVFAASGSDGLLRGLDALDERARLRGALRP